VLTAAGVARTAVVKTLCFITDPKDFALFDREYGAFLRTTRPARITVTVRLARHLLRLWTPDGDTCVLDVPLRHFGDNPIARYAERSGEPGVFAE
jgi:enamine deaminase RidA (YjgF/YER057c/UK114 family)